MLTVLFILFVVGTLGVGLTCVASMAVFRGVGRLVNGRPALPTAAGPVGIETARRCRNPGCRSGNPPHARFCRRCGASVADPTAATWRSAADRARLNQVV